MIWPFNRAPSFEQVDSDLSAGRRHYRVRRIAGGWEPQMLYTCGAARRACWFPLNSEGFWLEPLAFSFGQISKRNPLPRPEAQRAVLRARRLNEEQVLTLVAQTQN